MYLGGRMLTNALQHIDEIIVRIDVMQPTGDQQALHDANVPGAEFGPTKQPVFATHRDHPQEFAGIRGQVSILFV